MFNNRMMAVAAVLALAIPALGAAAPLAVPPVPEQLVEGHTVFTVVQAYDFNATQTRSQVDRYAAAVAVLVREYDEDQIKRQTTERFPGVLWFNDQYLVNPYVKGENFADRDIKYRYPCGGAVLAVNAGDPDPRVAIAKVPADSTNGQPDYAWIGVGDDTSTVYSDTVIGSIYSPVGNGLLESNGVGIDYQESYLITDPNDHSWVIDKYIQYTRVDQTGPSKVYSSPVWVVNTLGSPVYVPDDGLSTCNPYFDIVLPTGATVNPGETLSDALCGRGAGAYGVAKDDPCMGYEEPSAGGAFCYGGQEVATVPVGCDREAKPLRLYNALLYFKLEDLTVAGATRDHSAAGTDTNGCQVGTEWTCPGYDGTNPFSGDDNAEGNSHPFHPTAPPHVEAGSDCPAGWTDSAGSNHGGSDTDGVFDCTNTHATRNIDIYFGGRPFPPVVRNFVITDLEGSTAPFHGHH